MNQSELARKLGLTRQAISKLARRGMPIDSIEAANKWRLIHAPPRKTFVAAVADKAATPFQDAVTRAQRAKAVEEYLFGIMKDAAEASDIRLTAKISKDFLTAMHRAIELEQEAIATGTQMRELITTKAIDAEIDDCIVPFLQRCRLAESDPKNCGWYITPRDAAEQMRKTLEFFCRRLTPRDFFSTYANPQTQTN
jgi:transcriptional regulator with XRE-family HTH domain